MKRRVADLEGALLDYFVAKAEGHTNVSINACSDTCWIDNSDPNDFEGYAYPFSPSSDWAQGGPIIEREYIQISPNGPCEWFSYIGYLRGEIEVLGSTPLIAAMRTFIVSKFGEEIELPEVGG